MADLAPLTALGAAAPRSLEAGAFTLTERPDIALASLALRRGQIAPILDGLTLPAPGAFASGNGLGALWSGQGQWLIAGEGLAETDFAARVRAMAAGASVTDQTDGWTAIALTGDAARLDAVLERLVNLPPDALAPGRATRTVLHHMSVILVRHDRERLTIWGMRSAAGSLWHTLETVVRRLS
ncbi:MAG: sarcosine oxidase subunit gamma [Rhodobacter sp.]|nr:sarcosine oxidase subunit gamma [Paracoccaceae bacterium]MCC0077074.1 sarcosine oxidase subunit gamma [Rhodobacter sp.]